MGFKKVWVAACLGLGFLFSLASFSDDRFNPIADFDATFEYYTRVIETRYSALRIKQKLFGFDYEQIKNKYRDELKGIRTLDKFHDLLVRFQAEVIPDSHVSKTRLSTWVKALPISFFWAQSGDSYSTIVSRVEPEAMLAGCGAQVGDILLSMGGQTPEQLRAELGKYKAFGTLMKGKYAPTTEALTDHLMLTWLLTTRSEAKGIPVPQAATSEIRLRRPGTGQEISCTLEWSEEGIPLINRSESIGEIPQPATQDARSVRRGARALMRLKPSLQSDKLIAHLIRNASQLKGVESILETQRKVADTKIEFEDDGAKFWAGSENEGLGKRLEMGMKAPFFKLPDNFVPLEIPGPLQALVENTGFFVGTYVDAEGKTAGFLRIKDYSPELLPLALFGLRYVINQLEQKTDYLVLDQTFNPGGYVAYSDWIIASFVGEIDDKRHMRFAVRPSEDFDRNFTELLHGFSNSPIPEDPAARAVWEKIQLTILPLIKEDLKKVLHAKQRQQYLSAPVRLHTLSEIAELQLGLQQPGLFKGAEEILNGTLNGIDLSKRQVYSKPITMLINGFDFSGGDATPAGLQDYERVTLVGTRTAGAGGSVESFKSDFTDKFDFRLTVSLMIRYLKSFGRHARTVESIAVHPNEIVEMTREDFMNGFADYLTRALKASKKVNCQASFNPLAEAQPKLPAAGT